MKDIIILRSMKYKDEKRMNYNTPIEMHRVSFSDGIFLIDPILGTMGGVFAKEIGKGVYVSLQMHGQVMYEEATNE